MALPPIIVHDSLPSTNAEAMRLGLAGKPPPLWVRAERQTAGRGRSGRAWVSEPGNLYASLLVRLSCTASVLQHLSFVAAVATVAAIRQCAGTTSLSLRLKWPNDILLDGAKLTGILPETTLLAGGGALAVIGIGVNLAHAPDGLGRATTCLSAAGLSIAPRVMHEALAAELQASLSQWAEGAKFSAIRELWLADGPAPGTPMTVHAGDSVIAGQFRGLADDGALILRDHSGYDHTLSFGDVTLEAARSG
jgi:BirA family biotin operon repressor/biotin-[acetyl-CoA-carboxylase] ligase